MAIACLRLVTFRPDPLFSVPFFFRRIADSTVLDAPLPYFAIVHPRIDICKECAEALRLPGEPASEGKHRHGQV